MRFSLRYCPGHASGSGLPFRVTLGSAAQAGIRNHKEKGAAASVCTRSSVWPSRQASSLEVMTNGVPSASWPVNSPAPSQFRTTPSAVDMTAHSLSIPSTRGPFTEQQFSSGVPARAWKTMVWALASRVPSIGVL